MARVLGLVLSGLHSVLSVIVNGGGHYDWCKQGNWPAIGQVYARTLPPPPDWLRYTGLGSGLGLALTRT